MNYQQAIADAIKQIRFRSVAVDATTTAVSVAGSGFLSFCLAAAAATTMDLAASAFPMDAVVDVAVKTAITAVSAVGFGFSFFCPAAVAATTAADADAANVLICEGPFHTDPHNLYGFYSGTCITDIPISYI